MKKCNCKIMNTLGKYQKIWPWIGVAGYAVDGAEAVLKHTKWGKAHYKLRMLIHGAGAGLLCLGAGVHTVQAFATGKTDVPAVISGSVIGSGILGLNYTHAAAKKIGPKQARIMHRVFCGVTGLGMAKRVNMPISREPIASRLIFGYSFSGRVSGCGQYSRRSLISQPNTQQTFARKSRSTICTPLIPG